VVVEGTPIGRTPLDTSLASGRSYAVRVDKKGYVPSPTVRLDAAPDSTLERRVVLTAVAAQSRAETGRITDLRAGRTEAGPVLRYVLAGTAGAAYDVSLRAVGPEGAPIALPDSTIRGAVGADLSPGTGKQVVLRREIPGDGTILLTVDDAGGRRWLYVVGSAVVAGGSALMAFLLGGGDDGGFPSPPGLPP
jgi:hypothetical protein